jgi:hypothetical protein
MADHEVCMLIKFQYKLRNINNPLCLVILYI